MATVNLSPIGNGVQFLLPSGVVNANGYLSTYQAGTSTPVATYNSSAGSVENATSIPLGTDGAPASEIWIVSGTAVKFILEDSSGVPISGKTWDNIKGINDDTGLGVYWCGTATGTANALVLTPATPSTAYTPGVVYYFKSGSAANTGAATVNISGLGAIAIQDNGNALAGSEIQPNQWYQILIDATTTTAQLFGVINSLIVAQALTFNGAITFASSVSSTKAAPAGYARLSPNEFVKSGSQTDIALTTGNNTIAAPSGANYVKVSLRATVISSNAAATTTTRSVSVVGFTDNTFTTLIGAYASAEATEQVACNGTALANDNVVATLPVVAGNFYLKVTLTNCPNGYGYASIVGGMD